MYAYTYPDDPIIKGIIAESGTASMSARTETPSFASSANKYSSWYAASQKLGCGGQEAGEQTLACMRGKNFRDITKTIDGGMSNPAAMRMSFGPSGDGKVLKDISANMRAEKLARVVSTVLGGNQSCQQLTKPADIGWNERQ
jgi:hypothetical protein